jgi:hypothetical protein
LQLGDKGAPAMTWRMIPSSNLQEPEEFVKDIFSIFKKVGLSISAKVTLKCPERTLQFRSEGGIRCVVNSLDVGSLLLSRVFTT